MWARKLMHYRNKKKESKKKEKRKRKKKEIKTLFRVHCCETKGVSIKTTSPSLISFVVNNPKTMR